MLKSTQQMHGRFFASCREKSECVVMVENGASGISPKGLCRLAGISCKTFSKWIKTGFPAELGSIEENLYLPRKYRINRRFIDVIRSSAATEILLYAAFELKREEAREACNALILIGFDSYAQGVTGWLPQKYQESSLDPRHQITRLVREPNPWKRLYTSAVCDKIRSWYFPRDFFWSFAYSWMTQEEIAILNECNPVLPGTEQRKSRIFQHLSDETRDRLAPEIAALCTLVESSTGRQDFETRWQRVHGKDQQELALSF